MAVLQECDMYGTCMATSRCPASWCKRGRLCMYNLEAVWAVGGIYNEVKTGQGGHTPRREV